MPIALGVLIYIVLLLSLTVHEFSHALVANHFGDDTARVMGRMTLNPLAHIDPVGTVLLPLIMLFTSIPLIGWAKPVPVNPYRLRNPSRHHMLVAAAGPVSNLLLCAFCILLYRTLFVETTLGSGKEFLQLFIFYAAVLNAILAVFNLIPIPPLDGSRVMAELLPPRLAEKYHQLEAFGFLIIMALVFMGFFRLVLMPVQALLGWLMGISF